MSDVGASALGLAQLLCTRLCHDLAGPIGAVAAGVELTSGDPAQVDAETLGLIGNSSAAASRKLKFLRAALGVPSAPGSLVGELRTLTEAYLAATAGRNGPPALVWPSVEEIGALTDALGPLVVPLLLNMTLLVLEAQPACRRLAVAAIAQPTAQIVASAEGEGPRATEWRPEITGALAGDSGGATAKSVQAHFLSALAVTARGRINLSGEGSTLRATFAVA